MSLGIADVAAVIGIAVERTRPGRPVTGSSGRYGSLIKRIHLFLIIGKKANVKAITDAGRFAIDRHLHPELRVLLAIGHGIRMLHNNADTQAGEDGVIKRLGANKVVGTDRKMRNDAGVIVAHKSLAESDEGAMSLDCQLDRARQEPFCAGLIPKRDYRRAL